MDCNYVYGGEKLRLQRVVLGTGLLCCAGLR